jgi:hypothetical protein
MEFTVNGPKAPLGTILTGKPFNLTHFPDEEISFAIQHKGKQLGRTVKVELVIREALTYINTHCAKSKACNDYFKTLDKSNPITLKEILDQKKLQLYRIGLKADDDDKQWPEGFTHGWGPSYAQIGLNRIALTDSGNVAAVLLHELAHVAGAPGRESGHSTAAERALTPCGMGKFQNEEEHWGNKETKSDRRPA